MSWTDDELRGAGDMSFDEVLQMIDDWSPGQEATTTNLPADVGGEEEAPFAAQPIQGDDFATLMEDIDEMTSTLAAGIETVGTTSAPQLQPHSLASQHDLPVDFNTDLPMSDTTVTAPHSNQPPSDPTDETQIGPALPVRTNTAPDLLPLTPEQERDPPPTPEITMTQSAAEELPSSGGKSSLMEEMRSEEDDRKVKPPQLEMEVPKLDLSSPPVVKDDGAAGVLDGGTGLEDAISQTSHVRETKSKPTTVSQKRTSHSANIDSNPAPAPAAKKRKTAAAAPTRKSSRLHTLPEESETTQPEPEPSPADETTHKKTSAKKTKPGTKRKRAQSPQVVIPATSTTTNAAPRQKQARKTAVGGREVALLTQSPLLGAGAGVAAQAGAATRKTRAQKQEEAENVPNAAKAAKERRAKKG